MGSIIYLKNGDGKIELKNRHELKTFLSNSENKNKNILIKISATWCNPCKILDNNLYKLIHDVFEFKDGETQRYRNIREKKQIIIIDIDCDKYGDIDSFLKIKRLPTIIAYYNGERRNVLDSPKHSDLEKFMSKLD